MAKIKEIKVENVAAAIMMIKEYQERVSALKNMLETGGSIMLESNAGIDQYKEFLKDLIKQSKAIEII